MTGVLTERHARLREAALGYRIFAALRWGDLGDGHITARDPERTDAFWMVRSGVSFHTVTIADLVLISAEGVLLANHRAEPVDDVAFNRTAHFIHHPILAARTDVVSCAHTHTPWGTPFCAEHRHIEPISQESCFFFEDHSVFSGTEVEVQSVETGHGIAAALGSNRSVSLANHGLLTAEPSVAEAVAMFVTLERVTETHMKAPAAKAIPAEAARHSKAGLEAGDGAARMFWNLVDRHVGDADVVEAA